MYKQTSPESTIPSVDEFFTFCKFVSEEIFLKKTGGKRIHRTFSSDKCQGLDHIEMYESIVQMHTKNVFDRLTLCISIVIYALILYMQTGFYMKQSVGCTEETPALSIPALHWFCVHALPSLERYKGEITDAYLQLYQSKHALLETTMEGSGSPRSYYKTALQCSNVFDKIVVEPGFFNSYLKKHASSQSV
jgi:hypothetical protein